MEAIHILPERTHLQAAITNRLAQEAQAALTDRQAQAEQTALPDRQVLPAEITPIVLQAQSALSDRQEGPAIMDRQEEPAIMGRQDRPEQAALTDRQVLPAEIPLMVLQARTAQAFPMETGAPAAAGIMHLEQAATTTTAAMHPAITEEQAAQEGAPGAEERQKDALPPFWQ